MRILIIFMYLLLTVSFSTCVSTEKFVKTASYDTKYVPVDYDPSKHILLFAELTKLDKDERHEAATKQLDQALQKYFPYKYEIVSMKDITDKTKYSDTNIYKFGIANNYNIVRHTTTTTTTRTDNTGTHSTSVSPSARTTYISFGFYNRAKGFAISPGTNEAARIEWSVAAFSELVKRSLAENKKLR